MKRTIMSIMAFLSLLWGQVACTALASNASIRAYRLKFQVRDSLGGALSNASVSIDKQVIGVANPQGVVMAQLNGREGQEVKVSVACPEGYRGVELPEVVRLTKTRALDETVEQNGMLVEFTCESVLRDVVVVVHAEGGGGLPLRVGTQSAGVTDVHGNAELLFRIDREQTGIEVGINSGHRRELLPRNPSRTFSVGRNDAIVVYSERLIAEKPQVKVRRRVTPPPLSPRPIRLD